jgi:hypothetical protein
VGCFQLAQDRSKWWGFVNVKMNSRVPRNTGIFFNLPINWHFQQDGDLLLVKEISAVTLLSVM